MVRKTDRDSKRTNHIWNCVQMQMLNVSGIFATTFHENYIIISNSQASIKSVLNLILCAHSTREYHSLTLLRGICHERDVHQLKRCYFYCINTKLDKIINRALIKCSSQKIKTDLYTFFLNFCLPLPRHTCLSV